MLEIVSTIEARDRKFQIIKDDQKNGYWGVEDKNIKDGKVTVELNGISGFFHKTKEDTEKDVLNHIEIKHLQSTGIDTVTAIYMVCMGVSQEEAERVTGGMK